MSVQSEAALENGLITTLQKMSYEYVNIEEEKNLSANFKKQLEKHNKKKLEELGRTEFTESEFEKILILKSATIIQYTIKGRFMSR